MQTTKPKPTPKKPQINKNLHQKKQDNEVKINKGHCVGRAITKEK